MARKRMTQMLPWLLPVRKWQRQRFFYLKMNHDGNRYATNQSEDKLPHVLFHSQCPMYNKNTGFDMVYQENKVHNLKLAAVTLDKLLIKPGETFSFWQRVRHADNSTPYKHALAEVDGELTTQYGGGLCQISNLLCWMFLHTPLTIVERHGHAVKPFKEPPSDAPMGVDATISEGWLDLRVRNDTDAACQIALCFDDTHIFGAVRTEKDVGTAYRVVNGALSYTRRAGAIYEEVDVLQETMDVASGERVASRLLYRNRCEIRYALPDETIIEEETVHEQEKRGYRIRRLFA